MKPIQPICHLSSWDKKPWKPEKNQYLKEKLTQNSLHVFCNPEVKNLTLLIVVGTVWTGWLVRGDKEPKQFLERKLNKFSKSTSQFKFSSRSVLINRNKSDKRDEGGTDERVRECMCTGCVDWNDERLGQFTGAHTSNLW
jgi:hypothetical protein